MIYHQESNRYELSASPRNGVRTDFIQIVEKRPWRNTLLPEVLDTVQVVLSFECNGQGLGNIWGGSVPVRDLSEGDRCGGWSSAHHGWNGGYYVWRIVRGRQLTCESMTTDLER